MVAFTKIDVIIITDLKMMPKGKVVARGERKGNLFQHVSRTSMANMTETNRPLPSADVTLWHQRLGHLPQRSVMDLHKKGIINATGNVTTTNTCRACALGKMTRSPFPSRPNRIRASKIGEIVHSDVCGPFEEDGLNGERYFVTFIDDLSRHISIYAIQRKSEVFDRFKEYTFRLKSETRTERPIRKLISDNGGGYRNGAFQSFCSYHGIEHLTSCSYTPQQNGVAERANKTIMEGILSMLVHSGVDRQL